MAAEELDLRAQYERKPKVLPTVILRLEEDRIIVTSGPRPVHRDEYIHDWDTTWNEEGTEVVAVDYTVQFQKTLTDQPVMVERILDEFEGRLGDNTQTWDYEGLGRWVVDVLHGKDPR